MKNYDTHLKWIWLLLLVTFSTLQVHGQDCTLPNGVTKTNGFLKGTISLATSASTSQNVNLFIEDVDDYPQDVCPETIYGQMETLWQGLYTDLVQRGMTKSNLETMIKSISGSSSAGIYIKPSVNACGYNGLNNTYFLSRTIYQMKSSFWK